VYTPSPSWGAGLELLIAANSVAMLAGSLTIMVVPESKTATVFPRTDFPFTEMLLNDASHRLYLTDSVSALATDQCF